MIAYTNVPHEFQNKEIADKRVTLSSSAPTLDENPMLQAPDAGPVEFPTRRHASLRSFSFPKAKVSQLAKKLRNSFRKFSAASNDITAASQYADVDAPKPIAQTFEDGESVESLLQKLNSLNIRTANIKSLEDLKSKYNKKEQKVNAKYHSLMTALNKAPNTNYGSGKRVIISTDKYGAKGKDDDNEYNYKPSLISKSIGLVLLNKAFD